MTYEAWILVHILLFVVWLGGDIGVFILGQHFRKRDYPLETRLVLLKLLVINDMGPRTAWALMVPVSLTLATTGGFLPFGTLELLAAWAVGLTWLVMVWTAHMNDQTPLAANLRMVEFWLKVALTLFYTGLGVWLLRDGANYAPSWLAAKAFLFAGIFAAAIMIDVVFKNIGPALGALIEQGSSDETEEPVLAIMNKTRVWVMGVYLLLVLTAVVGTLKPELF